MEKGSEKGSERMQAGDGRMNRQDSFTITVVTIVP